MFSARNLKNERFILRKIYLIPRILKNIAKNVYKNLKCIHFYIYFVQNNCRYVFCAKIPAPEMVHSTFLKNIKIE